MDPAAAGCSYNAAQAVAACLDAGPPGPGHGHRHPAPSGRDAEGSRNTRGVDEAYFDSYGGFGIHREMLSDKVSLMQW